MFSLEEWEWPLGMERVFTVEPFESTCRWSDGLKKTTICAIPFYKSPSNGTIYSVFLFQRQNARGKARNYVDVDGASLDFRENLAADFGARSTRSPQAWATYPLDSHRFFQFPAATALLRGTTGYWACFDRFSKSFRLPFQCSRYSGQYLFRWLQEQLDDEHSEVAFAYHWLTQSDAYRLSRLQEFAPSLSELILRARQAALLATPYGTRSPQDFVWFPAIDGDPMWIEIEGRSSLLIPEHLEKHFHHWKQFLKRHFPPAPLDPDKTPLCVLFDYQICYKAGPPVPVENASATYHDHLEARVSLREWLQDKATPEEIEILLPSE